MIAIGHGPLAFPGVYGEAREDPRMARPHRAGLRAQALLRRAAATSWSASGIASVNEWANALDAGASCIALRRNPQPDEQDLNVPRCLFDGSGIDAFQGLSFDERVDFLGRALRGTSPQRRGWAEKIKKGRDEGRFEEVDRQRRPSIEPGPAGLQVRLKLLDGTDPGELDVTGVVCGTGFVKSALALPVAAAPGADLRRAGRARAHPAEDQLRRAAARPRGLAAGA